jgi:hypothetical protein
MEQKPTIIFAYFTAVMILEWLAERFLMPGIILGYEVALTCLVITLVFMAALKTIQHLENKPGIDRKKAH